MLLKACLYILDVKSALAYSVTPIVCREKHRVEWACYLVQVDSGRSQ